MRHSHGLALLLLLAPGLVRAQDTPESLLPATTQVYLRFDGLDAHRAAYAKTALGQMLQGDTGTFFTSLFKQLEEGASAAATLSQLLGGASPQQMKKMQADAKAIARLPGLLSDKGFLLALEVRSLEPPQGQLTLILPDAGAKPDPLFGALRLATTLAKADVKEIKVADRTVSSLNLEVVHLTWWVEGKHAVLTLGTDTPEVVVKSTTTGKHARLTANPLFKRLQSFDKFETSARAFVDTGAFVTMGGKRGPDVRRLLDDLGLAGLKSLVLYSGYDGKASRDLVEWDMPGPRKGLLTLLGGKSFRLADVPPLPPDVVSWSMTNFDTGTLYDTLVQAVENVVRLVSPDDVAKVKGFLQEADKALGIDLRKDLLGTLGDRLAQYSSPGEGPLALGQTILLRVKDADKLQGALDQAIKGLAQAAGVDVQIKKRNYRGAELRMVQVRQQGFIFVPTYTIVDGWLAVSLFPQPIEGYIARLKGTLPAWKPSPEVEEALRQMPKEFISISWSDPRPSVTQLLSIAPLIGGAVASFAPQVDFDVSTVPNAQEVTRHLFPNVTVTTDDGKTLRSETRASLSLPFDLAGLDTYAILGLVSAFGSFAGADFLDVFAEFIDLVADFIDLILDLVPGQASVPPSAFLGRRFAQPGPLFYNLADRPRSGKSAHSALRRFAHEGGPPKS
jgi:hypothetical protein